MLGIVRSGVAVATGLLAVGVLSASAPLVGAAQQRQVTDRVFPFDAGGELRVESQNGRVTVEAWDRSEVRVQITREVRAGDEKQASELMKKLSADVEVGSRRISIKSVYPKREESVGIWDVLGQRVGSLNIHYYIQVPRETRLTLKTSNGELRVRGTRGDLTGVTGNGSVDVTDVKGSVEVRTTNGEVSLAGLEGSAEAGTTNGAITAEIRRLDPGGAVKLWTTNGDVTVGLPSDLKAVLEAVTTNGRVVVGFPVASEGVASSKQIRGTIGGGGNLVSLRTTNGNVEVRKVGGRRA